MCLSRACLGKNDKMASMAKDTSINVMRWLVGLFVRRDRTVPEIPSAFRVACLVGSAPREVLAGAIDGLVMHPVLDLRTTPATAAATAIPHMQARRQAGA